MGTAQLAFVGVVRGGGATGSHVTGSAPDRKYVVRMRNRKLRNIRPSRALEVTSFT